MKTRLWLATLDKMYSNIIREYYTYILYNKLSETKKINVLLSCAKLQTHIKDAMDEIHNLTSLLQ